MRIRSVAPLLVLVLVWLSNETVPILAGTGSDAAFDWSLLYVTLRGVVIPAACAIVAVTNTIALVRATGRARVPAAFTVATALAIGAFQWLYQWPLFGKHP